MAEQFEVTSAIKECMDALAEKLTFNEALSCKPEDLPNDNLRRMMKEVAMKKLLVFWTVHPY